MRYDKPRYALFLVAMLVLRTPAGAEDGALGATSGLTLVGVAEQGGVVYVSLFDQATGDHFLPSTKAPDGGYELVAITEDEDAIVRHNGQSYRLRMGVAVGASSEAEPPPEIAIQTPKIPRPGSFESTLPTPPPGAKLPLVFQSGDMTGLNLTAQQRAIIIRLRGEFFAAIRSAPGSAAVSPTPVATLAPAPSPAADETSASAISTPPATAPDWISAQQYNDEIFRMLFGYQAFNAYEEALSSKP